MGFDLVALSFVQRPEDVAEARRILGPGVGILAKVERAEAVRRMEELVALADGAMVARGDLGVEVDLYQVPLVQKRLVDLANSRAKPVVVATQMLRSMVDSPVPTRAEVADVANAVWDGADALMLSEETATGRHPVEAVRAMAQAARAAEEGRSRSASRGSRPTSWGGLGGGGLGRLPDRLRGRGAGDRVRHGLGLDGPACRRPPAAGPDRGHHARP